MNNTKYIKIVSIIITTFLLIFIVLYINNRNIKNNTPVNTINNQQNKDYSRNNLNTKTSTTTVEVRDFTNMSEGVPGKEEEINKKIKQNLQDWEITKDKKLLEDSLKLTLNTDNEAVLEAWVNFIPKNSSELIKIIDTSTNKLEVEKTVKLILDWYINLSGNYDKLSPTQKSTISNQYKQLK